MRTTQLPRRAFTLVEIMVVVVIIGLLVALASPGFRKIRRASQDKAVLSNLRLMVAASDQYFLEYGVSTVASVDLVGLGRTNYVKPFKIVANEVYPETYVQGGVALAEGLAGSRTISYSN